MMTKKHFKMSNSKEFETLVKGASACYVYFKRLDFQLYVLKWSIRRLKEREIPLEIDIQYRVEGSTAYTLFLVF